MTDEVDAVQETEHLLVEEKRKALERTMEKEWADRKTGTCLFCGESCDNPQAVLHPDCIEDYNKQERMRQRGFGGAVH